MTTTTKSLFTNLLYLVSELSQHIPLGKIDSILEKSIDEIKSIFMEYEKDIITEQIVLDRLETMIKSIDNSNDEDKRLDYLKLCVENTIPMFKCFLLSSSSN